MKNRFFSILLSALTLSGINISANAMSNFSDDISFYKVPLVCNAAPSIGCGSRSKPVLLDLEKSDVIKEAWLNRQGNVIAIVWTDNSSLTDRKNGVVAVFDNNHLNASELMMDDYTTNLDSFTEQAGWYRGDDVNALSKEEAGIIADQLITGIKVSSELKEADEAAFKKEIQDIFYSFFLNYKSMDQLADATIYKQKLGTIVKLGEKYVGEGNMPSVDELWKVCSGGTAGCNDASCNDSCKKTG